MNTKIYEVNEINLLMGYKFSMKDFIKGSLDEDRFLLDFFINSNNGTYTENDIVNSLYEFMELEALIPYGEDAKIKYEEGDEDEVIKNLHIGNDFLGEAESYDIPTIDDAVRIFNRFVSNNNHSIWLKED